MDIYIEEPTLRKDSENGVRLAIKLYTLKIVIRVNEF